MLIFSPILFAVIVYLSFSFMICLTEGVQGVAKLRIQKGRQPNEIFCAEKEVCAAEEKVCDVTRDKVKERPT